MYILMDIGKSLLSNIIQLLAGCAISMLFIRFAGNKLKELHTRQPGGYLSIVVSTFCGVLFPMETFGILPVAAAAYTAGARLYMIAPAVFANAVFNTLTPFTDVGFIWRTGIYRILTAIIIGVCSGILLRLVKIKDGSFIKERAVEAMKEGTESKPGFAGLVNSSFMTVGPYLIIGVVIDAIFMKYIFYDLMNSINIGLIATAVFGRFKGYDITTPVFMQTMFIFYKLVSIRALLALIAMFRLKSLLGYYLYFFVWVVFLAIINILFI